MLETGVSSVFSSSKWGGSSRFAGQKKKPTGPEEREGEANINGKGLAGVRGKMAAAWVVIQTGNQCDSSAGQSGKR